MATDPFEPRLRAGLRAALGDVVGPHPAWASSPAAARITADETRRRPWWRTGRLLAVAAIFLFGAGVAILAGLPRRVEVGGACPTLDDYADASAAPTPMRGEAPAVAFPSVGPTASSTPGLQPPGAWIVIADDQGPAYQMRVRDVRSCERLPTVRSVYPGGSLLLAQFDVEVLRSNGLDAWIGPDERLTVEFGSSTPNTRPLEPYFGVPGMVRSSSLSPARGFAQSTLIIVDVPATDASVQLRVAEPDGQPMLDGPGWRVRDGAADHDLGSLLGPGPDTPRPGATATLGTGTLGATTTILVPDGALAARVGELQAVPRYPGLVPPDGEEILEMRVAVHGWDPATDPATDWPSIVLDDIQWVVTDATGTPRPNIGDGDLAGGSGVLQGLAGSMWSDGLLAFVVPRDGPVRLALHRDGVELAWWSLRD